jgi:hypothetical protein
MLPGEVSTDAPELSFFASRRSADEGFETLLTALRGLVGEWNECGLTASLALELEPGPLFTLNGRPQSSLSKLAKAIDDCPVLRGRVGLNVDIAHYILADISPDVLFKDDAICKRISHFHISDHGLGHFGDAALGHCDFGESRATGGRRSQLLLKWVRAALRYAEKRRNASVADDAPAFSGLISVEIEAAASPNLVQESCDVLKAILAAEYGQVAGKPAGVHS